MNERDTYRSQFAAYFAGQLTAEDAARLEAALARDAKLAREAEALQTLAALIKERAQTESGENFRLSGDRLAVIRAAATGHIVEFPGVKRPSPQPSRSGVFILRRVLPAFAAAVAVIVGTFAGFNPGQVRIEPRQGSWQVATQLEPESRAVDSAANFHYEPAYGLDHRVFRPVRGRAAIGFAMSVEPNYGLPGPPPSYLITESFFLLQ